MMGKLLGEGKHRVGGGENYITTTSGLYRCCVRFDKEFVSTFLHLMMSRIRLCQKFGTPGDGER
jgi:hypothetical protein